MGSKGAGHPPLPHPPPSIWVQEQQKLRLVQIAEAPYSVLSGGWHGGSRGADDRESRNTGAMKPLRPLRSLPAVWESKACLAGAPGILRIRGGAGRICLQNPTNPTWASSRPEGRLAGPSPPPPNQPGQHLITVSPVACP